MGGKYMACTVAAVAGLPYAYGWRKPGKPHIPLGDTVPFAGSGDIPHKGIPSPSQAQGT
jgi:hypothetical protein